MSMDSVEAAVASTFPADEATESKTDAPSPAEGGGDLRSEMIAYLKAERGEGEETEDPAPEAKESKPAPEAEAKADESDEDEEATADESGDEPDKPKKVSGWQKAKKKIADLEARSRSYEEKVAQLEDRDAKWEHVTSLFEGRLNDALERAERAEARLRELGAGPDPRDGQLADYERRLREQTAEIERREREFAARQQRAAEQAQARAIANLKAQVASVAEAHGLNADDLAEEAASRAQTARYRGRAAPSLEEVAVMMSAYRRAQAGAATQAQADVSQSAPRPVRGTAPSPTAPSFEPTTAGALAFLKSQGLM